jgi:hypothetical protein
MKDGLPGQKFLKNLSMQFERSEQAAARHPGFVDRKRVKAGKAIGS